MLFPNSRMSAERRFPSVLIPLGRKCANNSSENFCCEGERMNILRWVSATSKALWTSVLTKRGHSDNTVRSKMQFRVATDLLESNFRFFTCPRHEKRDDY